MKKARFLLHGLLLLYILPQNLVHGKRLKIPKKDLETWENMGNAAFHLIDTLSTMYNAFSDSFINDVINGEVMLLHKLGLDSLVIKE
ncbi:hypothetical protein AT259_15470 [Bacillus cereus]|nr:hypothetical protein AT259_15470 [Bacillus cereus]